MPRIRLVAIAGLIATIGAITVAAVLLVSDGGSSEPAVTLVGVPQAELDAQNLTLAAADLDEARIDRRGILELVDRIVICAQVRQSELVTLTNGDTGDTFIAWAINYDTRTASNSPAFGGKFRISCTNEADFFVAFLDARTGKLVYILLPGHGQSYSPDPAVPETLTRGQLDAAGIGLITPTGGSSTVDPPAYAHLYNLPAISGAPIQEVLLATLTSDIGGVLHGRLVWVVTTAATCKTDNCEPKPTIVLLDGYTHEFLYATEVS